MDDFSSLLEIAIASAVSLTATVVLLARGSGRRVPGCAPGSGCDAVASSRWARLGRIPVALPGALTYAAMVGCALVLAWIPPEGSSAALWRALVGLAALAAGAAAWFGVLQALVMRRLCLYCVIAHLAALGAGAILLPRALEPSNRTAALAGIGAAIVLALLQSLLRPDSSKFIPIPARDPTPGQSDVPTAGPPPRIAPPPEVSVPPTVQSRPIALLGGQLKFDASLFPVLGSHEAKHLIAYAMDYTCEHCREVHPTLEEALGAFNGELALSIFVTPLDRTCNPHIGGVFDPRYVNACAYARLALSIWATTPAQFATYHRWLMTGAQPPSLDEARRKAAEILGGEAALDAAVAGAAAKTQLTDALTIFRLTNSGPLPRLLLPGGILFGSAGSVAKLVSMLKEQLVAPTPTVPAPIFSGQQIG